MTSMATIYSITRSVKPVLSNWFVFLAWIFILFINTCVFCQSLPAPAYLAKADRETLIPISISKAAPLDNVSIVNAVGKTISVTDGTGKVYFNAPVQPINTFTVLGALGTHTVTIIDKKGNNQKLSFQVNATTNIDDGGRYGDMFDLFYTSMQTDTGSVKWNGHRYRYFVPWGLDHCHTMKGLKYFYNFGGEFIDLSREAQREDGMIWSFVEHMPNMDYWRTRDAKTGYTTKIGDKYFVRQPTENHPEYIFVKTTYQWWKASGDDNWMKKNLSACAKALDYCMKDPARWSKRFQLLKRVYTIDSWDFQVDDEYTPDIGITNTMIIDPEKSKFGVFFGDNTAYVMACRQLAEMYERANNASEAASFRQRAVEIEQRLNALSWNGRFFTHFIEEDPTVKRNLGVDEKSQLAQSNAYSLNRGISHEKSKAIIESYLQLRSNLPIGSPAEWYAIYPPFERGFDIHGAKWQYMNGGVGGHVAGELARGAFENGYESYATDILERLYELGKKYDSKIYFAYTGSIPPPPPPPTFKSVDLAKTANMDSWINYNANSLSWMNSKRQGDDFRKLPTGSVDFKGIQFNVIDPSTNDRKAVVAISRQKGFPVEKEIAVNDKAASVYFLHTSGKPTSENVSASISIVYADGATITRYMLMGKQLTYWWFSQLKTDYSGIAWYGDNEVSKGIGLSWCSIDNPHPEKEISKIILHSAQDETIYTVFAISLSNQRHYIPIKGPSFGGPDNWAAATAMAAMIEGLAGVKDSPNSQAFDLPMLSPRWNETKAANVNATIRYSPSNGYVAYRYQQFASERKIKITATTGGKTIQCRILVPDGSARKVEANGVAVLFQESTIEKSRYVNFAIDPLKYQEFTISY